MVNHKRIIDISLPLKEEIVCYPGDVSFSSEFICTIKRSGCTMRKLTIGTHTGTHIDAPSHFLEGREGVDELPLEACMGMVQVVETKKDVIDREFLEALELAKVCKILFKTNNSLLLNKMEFHKDYVYLTLDGAKFLAKVGMDVVGIDYLSIERFGTPDFSVHKFLLGKGIYILEGIDLRKVVPGIYFLIVLPLRIKGGDGSPVRAILLEV